jgi:hypothetical protein
MLMETFPQHLFGSQEMWISYPSQGMAAYEVAYVCGASWGTCIMLFQSPNPPQQQSFVTPYRSTDSYVTARLRLRASRKACLT